MSSETMKMPILCRIGKHDMRAVNWPLGYAKSPNCVGECKRCGQVRHVEATAWGGVELGRWASLAEMRQREAAGTADEKPDGQAENANVDLPDTAAQDSASKSNNPAVSG